MIFSEFHNDTIDLTIDFYGFEQCDPKYGFGPAIRENYVLHYIDSGKGTFYYKGQQISLSAGDIFLLKPNELTYYEADADDPWSYYWIGISGSKASEYFNLSSIHNTSFLRSSKESPTNIIYQLMTSIILPNKKQQHSITSHLHLLGTVYELLFKLSTIAPNPLQKASNPSEQLCLRCRKIIDTTYTSSTLSIQHIADTLSVNRSYLTTIFTEYFHTSPKEYLNQVRMRRAKYLLEHTQEPIKFIAYSVGFLDPLYFSKAFKTYYKISPSQFRKSLT